MCYRQAKPQEVGNYQGKVGLFSETQEIIVGGLDKEVPRGERRLVLAYWTQDQKLMVLRTKPVVLDSSKFNTKENHNRQYARLLMFRHWNDETAFLSAAQQSKKECHNMYMRERLATNEVADGLKQLLRKSWIEADSLYNEEL